MTEFDFVFPNLSSLRQRGGLSSRASLAKELGCSYLEVPCDFVKNRGEVERTGVPVGSPLTPGAVAELYDAETRPAPLPYILHTEPSLPRRGEYGIPSPPAPLRWYDRDWTDALVEMTILVAERLNPSDADAVSDFLVRARKALAELGDATQAALEAGYVRFRPVLMTALAMIIGMAPMALGLGEGGEQNAPLGRAVIGGLFFATIATLIFVPVVFSVIHRHHGKSAKDTPAAAPGEPHVA